MELNDLTLDLEMHVDIRRAKEDVFEGLIAEVTEKMRYPDGKSMNMRLERRPGGRWYRDLGDDTGHLWGIVQSIKPPELLEFFGPMFMSYAVAGHLIFRLSEVEGGTRVSLRHRAVGMIDPQHRAGVSTGWGGMLDELKKDLEG